MAADPTPAEDRDLLVEAVRAAAAVALSYFGGPVKEWTKPDGTDVSEADIATDEALAAALRAARPDYGWLSEELGTRAEGRRRFIVDPIDGTSAYLKGDSAWTVVAAVVEGPRPLAGVIYRPVNGDLYEATLGGGARLNGRPIAVSAKAVADTEIAVNSGLFNASRLGEEGVRRGKWVPSMALRLAKVAAATLDAAVSKTGPHHWDLAAADLIVQEAGGVVTDPSGAPLRYDAADTRHPPTFAGPRHLVEALRERTAGHLKT